MPKNVLTKEQSAKGGRTSKRTRKPSLQKIWDNLDQFVNDEFISHYITIIRKLKKDGKDKEYMAALMQLLKYVKPVKKSVEVKGEQKYTIEFIDEDKTYEGI